MIKKQDNKGGEAPTLIECLCKSKISEKDIMAHVKTCIHIKATFGTLPEAIDNSIKAAKDNVALKVLYNLFNQSKKLCRSKIKEEQAKKGVPAPPMPAPVPVIPVLPEQPVFPKKPPDHEEIKEVKPAKVDQFLIDQNSVYCKICSTHFLDFNEIMYLQRCPHAFCKKDLKILIFKYKLCGI
jgi:hypothetical protein